MSKKRFLVIVGIVAAAVLLSVLFYTMLANHRPAITSLEAESERVSPRGSCQITCTATDRVGDELSYNWSADGGEINGKGAAVNWTAPYLAGSYNVTVIVTDSRGSGVTRKVTIEVRTNRAPTIDNLVANVVWTTPSGNLQVTCNATDPDGDELSYEWTATGGDISGTGTVVNWTAPQEIGIYNVTVVVRDGCGGGDIRGVLLSVSPGTPPTIENLAVTAKEPRYLKTTTTGYKVWKAKEYDIECVASNASGELVYDWSCDGGEISGEGSKITWTAPNQSSVDATVTVIVSDVTGNKAGRSINFNVPSCACGF